MRGMGLMLGVGVATGAFAIAAYAGPGPRPAARSARVEVRQEHLSDANILAEMKGGDSVEVVLSKWVRERTENRALRTYTEMLTRDHEKGVKEVEELAEKVHIRPEAPSDDTAGVHNQHVQERLEHTARGFDFDTAAATHWIRDHRHDIQDTQKMIREAKNAAVRNAARKEMPTLRKHLSAAERLQATLVREHRGGGKRSSR